MTALTRTGLLRRSLLFLSLATLPALPQQASLEPIGGQDTNIAAVTAISDDGKVIVGERRVANGREAFVWREGSGVQPLPLPGAASGTSTATSVSGDGRVIVGSFKDPAGRSIPVRWVDSQPRILPLPGDGDSSGFAARISRDGKVVVGAVGPALAEDLLAWKTCRWNEQGNLEPIDSSPAQYGYLEPNRLAVSRDGSVIALALSFQPQVYRWSPDVGFVQLKLEPGAYEFGYPRDWNLTMTGDGRVLGTARFQKRVFQWNGLGAGQPLPLTLSTNPAFRLVANDRGSLLAGITTSRLVGSSWSPILVPPFGPLAFAEVLRGQGVDTTGWSSLTNLSAISADGRWLVGMGRVAPQGESADRTEAFRAKLVLHGEGAPQLDIQVFDPDSDSSFHQLRWPATDLLVTVESRPMIHPDVPWTPESGAPRIEGDEIVLDLPRVTETRYFRLRCLD